MKRRNSYECHGGRKGVKVIEGREPGVHKDEYEKKKDERDGKEKDEKKMRKL